MWWPSELEAASWGLSSCTLPSGGQNSRPILPSIMPTPAFPSTFWHAGAWQLCLASLVVGSMVVPTLTRQQVCMLLPWLGWLVARLPD